jgi:hypothetical protein
MNQTKKNIMKTKYNKTFDASFTVENHINKTIVNISGRIIALEADSLWMHVNEWIKDYMIFPNDETEINLGLEYINTRNVVELFKVLKRIERNILPSNKVYINFLCETGDFDMAELGYDMNVLCGLPFKIKYVEPIKKSA